MATPVPRRLAATLLAVMVVTAHLGVGQWVAELRLDTRDDGMRRFEVAFVRELSPATPPKAPVRPAPRGDAAGVAAAPASAPASASAPVPEPAPSLATTTTAVPVPGGAEPGSSLAAALTPEPEPEPTEPTAVPTEPEQPRVAWPPSTRLSYALSGHYRGPVEGSAQVEWLRTGSRYQVHLDVVVGLRFAPLLMRTMSSEGRLGEQGLEPARYEEVTHMALRESRSATIRFGRERIELPQGRQATRPQEVQDAVSQFVQLTWRWRTDPGLLAPGQLLVLMLALPSGITPWIYDVGPEETLWTPFGPVQALPLRPRRSPRRGGDLVPTTWFAPSLQYLPVRIVIHQDEQTFIDLMLERLPLQAAATPAIEGTKDQPAVQPPPKRSP